MAKRAEVNVSNSTSLLRWHLCKRSMGHWTWYMGYILFGPHAMCSLG